MTGDSWGFQEGEEVAAGVRCVQLIGGGPDYEVYLVWDEELFSLVVAKMLRPSRLEDEDCLRKFLREADILEALDHPVVVRLFGSVMSADMPMLLMEHLDGPSLGALIRHQGPVDSEQILALSLQLCSALHYIHGKGSVHLDIEPDNVIMTIPPRLIGFSIARSIDEAGGVSVPLGTDAYMSPEQCDPTRAPIGPPADVWGLGATVYHATTGRKPFGDTSERFPQLERHADPLDDPIPATLRDVIFACLDPDPWARPSPSQVALALEDLVSALPREPVLVPPKLRLKPKLR